VIAQLITLLLDDAGILFILLDLDIPVATIRPTVD
jgi:hypothetical protein